MSPAASPALGGAAPGDVEQPADSVDARLVRESLSGSRSARRALIDRYQHAVYNLALRMLGAQDAAAGVAEETFVKAFRRLPSLPASGRLAPWLLRIAHNTAVEALRRAEPHEADVAPAPSPALPTPAIDRSPVEVSADEGSGGTAPTTARRGEPLADAFERLPVRYRAALVLRYQAGLSFAEVGEVMGVPEPTARARVESARRALAEHLSPAPRG